MDLIEEILDIFEDVIYTEAHHSMIPTDMETMRGNFRKELDNLFEKQDKISLNGD